MSVTRTKDIGWVNGMINHPDITADVRDDSHVGRLDVTPLADGDTLFLRLSCDEQDAGFVVMIPRVNGYEMHSGLLQTCRGKEGISLLREAIGWTFANTNAEQIVSWSWNTAKHVLLVGRLLKFKEVDREPWGVTVKGKHVERVMLALTKETFTATSH